MPPLNFRAYLPLKNADRKSPKNTLLTSLKSSIFIEADKAQRNALVNEVLSCAEIQLVTLSQQYDAAMQH